MNDMNLSKKEEEKVKLKTKVKTYWETYKSHFSRNPTRDGTIYLIFLMILFYYTIILSIVALVIYECDEVEYENNTNKKMIYNNPKYNEAHCLDISRSILGGLSLRQCDFGRRILASLIYGSVIGYERRAPDRPAGVRTMSLVCLGSCCFTLTSMFAFEDGSMNWDASRVSAAIPSGVGFLGAGLIWKGFVGTGEDQTHQVHGLTTAASVWISAAVGVAVGGAMYFTAAYTIGVMVLMLRFGPRSDNLANEEEDSDDDIEERADALRDLEAQLYDRSISGSYLRAKSNSNSLKKGESIPLMLKEGNKTNNYLAAQSKEELGSINCDNLSNTVNNNNYQNYDDNKSMHSHQSSCSEIGTRSSKPSRQRKLSKGNNTASLMSGV